LGSGGTPRFDELLAKANPEFSEGFLHTHRTYREELEEIKQELRTFYESHLNESRYSLSRVEKAGAKPEQILHLLAIEVHGRMWPNKMRLIKNNQKKLATSLREDANRLDRMYNDQATYPDLWRITLAFQEEQAGPVIPASERVPRSLIEDLRARADELDQFARDLGTLMKQYMPKAGRRPVEELLLYVHYATGDVRKHFVALAEILTDLYGKFRIKTQVFPDSLNKKRVSPESLNKLFYRHVEPLIVKRYHQLVPPDKTPT
jgi:hypothetical protein